MAKKKPSPSRLHTESYRTLEHNLYKLAYFLGTTEQWYGKQARILAKQLRLAKKELPVVEIEMDRLVKRSKLSQADEKRFAELAERVDDLTDVDIFFPTELKLFRQFSELIRVLGLSYLVTIFEGYLVDIVREILLAHPDVLKSGRQLTAETVLDLGGQKQIVSYLAEREVEELLYRGFPDVVNYFDKKFNINVNASGVSAGEMVEILATRNIHVHNRGMVNRRYLESVRDSRLKVGAYKSITREYLKDSINSIRTLVQFIDTEVQRKYFANQDTKKTNSISASS